jgi:tetratricopeptide (TPR) repeat protein
MAYTPLELAVVFIQTGELTDALDALDEHLTTFPADYDARRLRIETLLRLQGESHLRAALADFARLEAPTPDDWVKCSVVYERLSDAENALRAMDSALAGSPGDERLTERRIHLLCARGDYDAALRTIGDMPRSWRWQQWAGDGLAQAGRADEAAAAYTDALAGLEVHAQTLAPSWAAPLQARLLLARAGVYRGLDQLELAEADYALAGDLVPDDPMIGFGRGLIAFLRGDMQMAEALCGAAFAQASERLRQAMRAELEMDVRYTPLREKMIKF